MGTLPLNARTVRQHPPTSTQKICEQNAHYPDPASKKNMKQPTGDKKNTAPRVAQRDF
ncbi:MAG TPA: hypothetical protein VF043_14405 [Ktedonobacteraceae bacterium]